MRIGNAKGGVMQKQILVLKVNSAGGFRGKDLANGKVVSVKASSSFHESELLTTTVEVIKEWDFKNVHYLQAKVIKREFILENIDVPGLEFTSIGIWNPRSGYDDGALEYFADYLREGLRESFEFNDYTGYGFYGLDSDPVYDSTEADSPASAYAMLSKLWEAYPQCIDALVHIGNINFKIKYKWQSAMYCYQSAVHIAQKLMPSDLDGVFLWSCLANRPYLRALHGMCLVHWRLGEFDKAIAVATKLLRVNPPDNGGTRFILEDLKARKPWTPD